MSSPSLEPAAVPSQASKVVSSESSQCPASLPQDLTSTAPEQSIPWALTRPIVRDYAELAARIEALGDRFAVEKIGAVRYGSDVALPNDREFNMYRVVVGDRHDETKPAILISGGVHGQELAGIQAALEFLEQDASELADRFRFFVYPCVNPSGYEIDARWNLAKQDINRNFFAESVVQEAIAIARSLEDGPAEYLFSMDLHETLTDDAATMAEQGEQGFEETPEEFYIYEDCPDRSRRLGQEIVAEVGKLTKICQDEFIAQDTAVNGVIWYPEGNHNPNYAAGKSFDQFLRLSGHTQQAFTTETYGDVTVAERAAVQRRVITAALEAYLARQG